MESKEIKLTPEQEHLLEVTAKWLATYAGAKWETCNENWRIIYKQRAAALLKVQQAAGAVLKDSDQTEPEPLWTDCWEAVQANKFVKVQPLTGGKE